MAQRRQQREKRSKRPRPSYEEGKLRDPSIEEDLDPEFQREDLFRFIRKAATRKRPSR